MRSAAAMHSLTAVLKKRLAAREEVLSRAAWTVSRRFGSWMGRSFVCHALMRASDKSTIVTSTSGLCFAMTEHVGPPC